MCQLLLLGTYIQQWRKETNTPFLVEITFKQLGVYRTYYLLFGLVRTKHCIIMIWKKVRFLYMEFMPFDMV